MVANSQKNRLDVVGPHHCQGRWEHWTWLWSLYCGFLWYLFVECCYMILVLFCVCGWVWKVWNGSVEMGFWWKGCVNLFWEFEFEGKSMVYYVVWEWLWSFWWVLREKKRNEIVVVFRRLGSAIAWYDMTSEKGGKSKVCYCEVATEEIALVAQIEWEILNYTRQHNLFFCLIMLETWSIVIGCVWLQKVLDSFQ